MADDTDQRIRLVVLGGGGVGKTAIIKRFLFKTFEEKYRSTVEDLYYREYDIGSVTIKVDILDTAGDLQFPAMRRLSIATAGAFLLVYSLTCPASFDILKQCFQEIRDNRSDFDRVPIVVVGNKAEVDERHKQGVFPLVFTLTVKSKTLLQERSGRE
uniref:Small monomeric GTPase n=1 Tax=Strigamia maritima TaxID=126957 RepID=T1IYA3_STRMM